MQEKLVSENESFARKTKVLAQTKASFRPSKEPLVKTKTGQKNLPVIIVFLGTFSKLVSFVIFFVLKFTRYCVDFTQKDIFHERFDNEIFSGKRTNFQILSQNLILRKVHKIIAS
jgi:hypothetical protein